MLYMMLSGRPPFTGSSDKEITDNVRFADIILHSSDWRKKSRDCIDFLRRLLIRDPNKRSSAVDALEHPWLERMRKLRIAEGGSIAATGKASKKEILKAL